MPRRASVFIACVLIAAQVFAGCGARQYVVHAEDYARARQHGGLVGAVTMRCRETAILAHRTDVIDIELDPRLRGAYHDYVAVQERTSRSLSVGFGIGGLLLGALLGSMGGFVIYDAASTPHDGNSLPESSGKVLGSGLVVSGVAFAVTGIAIIAQGATRGAESPRRWQPTMTESTPCVVHRHNEAYERARLRAEPRDRDRPKTLDAPAN